MRPISLRTIVFTLGLLVPSLAASQASISLDNFLVGFANGCDQDDAWLKFRKALVEPGLRLSSRVTVPDSVRPAIGAAAIVSRSAKDGTILVAVDVKDGTFRGIPVKSFRLGFAEDYPLIDDSVIFSVSGDEVLATFAEDLGAVLRDNPESIVEYSLHDDPEGPRLTCFVTN